MKRFRATTAILCILFLFFAIELASKAIGNDSSQLRLGALPDSGGLHGQYWRVFTYSLLHSGYVHILLNAALLWWTGRIVERRVGSIAMVIVYCAAVLSGGILIALWKSFQPTLSVTVGASAGIYGLLSASLVLLYRPSAAIFGQSRLIRRISWSIFGVGVAISFVPGVSFIGHLAGLISGAILGLVVPIVAVKVDHDLLMPTA